jgi:hypothetical protein
MENSQATVAVPRPIVAGPEMAALERFYPDVTWVGHIVEGGMGPGTPAMSAHGCGIHESIQDGRWIVGTYEQEQYTTDGALVLTWQLHWVVGWDPARHEYRATMADNYGHADVMSGHLDGDRLVFTTAGGGPVQLRMVWDAADPRELMWSNESSVGGGPWTLIERYHLHPMRFEDE